MNSICVLNIVASSCDLPHGFVPWHGIIVVKRSEELLDGGSGDISLVEWHLMEEVVGHMCRSNLVVEEVEDSIWSVNGRKSSSDPGPFIRSILWNRRVVVLKPCVQDKPEVSPEVGSSVPKTDGKEAVVYRELEQKCKSSDLGNSREKDLSSDLVVEHFGVGAEVINNFSFLEGSSIIRETSSRGKSQKIKWPSKYDVREDFPGGEQVVTHNFVPSSVERETFIIWSETVLDSSGRDVTFSIGKMVGPSVVLSMRILPGEVRDKLSLVNNKTYNIVEKLAIREGSMSTFVCKDPVSGENGSHPECITVPSQKPNEGILAQKVFW